MTIVTTIGLDIAKRVFQVHGADAKGRMMLQKKLRREEVLAFFAELPRCVVGMEACASSHHWAREISALGHDTRMIPASYVKPYIARQKNDAADAAGICEAVSRPAVRPAQIKSRAQQAARVVHRTHEILSRHRVGLINAIRAHMAEFGVVAAAGPQHVGRLIERITDPKTALPDTVRDALTVLADQLHALSKKINHLEAQMTRHCRKEPEAARLLTIPGIGPITASAILAGVPDIHGFRSGRDFAAWLGLVPKQNSSGGKERLGRITKMGDRTIRRLLVIGAMSTIRLARRKDGFEETWLGRLIAKKPTKLAAVALANKTARIVWAVMSREETYRTA